MALLATGATLVAFGAAGCESTQDKSSKLSQEGSRAFERTGLRIKTPSKDVEVIGTTTLQDPNGTAVAVRLRNTSDRLLVKVPLAIDVQDGGGTSLFRNDASGLDPSLVGIATLRPKEEVTWVNDQVVATDKPAKVVAVAGAEGRALNGSGPRLTLQQITQSDDVAGITVKGFVMNKSQVEQRDLVIYAVATRGGQVVAAGRGQVPRVKPGQRARFTTFFIGDPTGAKLDLAVPATSLG